MKTQEQEIVNEAYEALKYIIDPEIGINIVDLGLVYKVTLKEDEEKLHIELTLTTPGCPMSGTITTAAEQMLHKRFPNLDTKVELVWLPPWTPDMISEEGMRQLGNT
ncbi:metal-sulfur cluster assembly factor [Pontibacter indicus]|uniref:Metal-sulfur cluster biosynthetic enzyme n=1 Tax=Pontibacter indicus TaxID=1317125 RepID=A0A1R3WBC1_9BACT|nr:metal-sulfur cluster assembly factor [Pontibacter indicus]SIT75067.1 Metal-sulfur cluster biosynthetic enzyme [Pontibacter indicus]